MGDLGKAIGKMLTKDESQVFGLTAAVQKFVYAGDIPEEGAAGIAKALEAKFGKLIGKFIGGGGKGYAWMIGHDLVLKLTSDQQEAFAASILLGKRHPNVGFYKHVAKIGNTDLYAIVQEYAGGPIKDAYVKKAVDNLPDDTGKMIPALKELVQTSSHPVWEQLLSGVLWLRDNGIKYFDIHSDNVVQDGETYKIIDVGIGDPEPMHLGRINLEQKMGLAFSDVEVINPPYQID
jgi:serine/threonine protein kinase